MGIYVRFEKLSHSLSTKQLPTFNYFINQAVKFILLKYTASKSFVLPSQFQADI